MTSTGWSPRRGQTVGWVTASVVSVTALLSGCLGDGPVDPEVQPLEVVLGQGKCLLNVPEVAAGSHSIIVIHELGDAAGEAGGSARLLDPAGNVLFEGTTKERMESEPVRLETGTYQVECVPDDGAGSTVSLLVKTARPGYGDPPTG